MGWQTNVSTRIDKLSKLAYLSSCEKWSKEKFMSKVILLPIILAISAKVYAGKLTALLLTGLILPFGVTGDLVTTHHSLSQSFGGVTPTEQMDYVKTLPIGCVKESNDVVATAIDKTTISATTVCNWGSLPHWQSVGVMLTRSLPQDHTIQSFCDGGSRGVKVLFKHQDRSVALYFRTDGTLEKADIVNENVAEYRKGFSTSYLISRVKSMIGSCIGAKSDTLPAVLEADADSVENQRALRIIDNANSDWEYTSHDEKVTNTHNTADKMLKGILSGSSDAIIEHSKAIGDGVVLTTIYKGNALKDYTLFMRNKDGTIEVVGLNPDLSTQSAFPLRQGFDQFAQNVGEETVITTSGTGNKKQTKRFDLVSKTRPAKKTKCVTTQYKSDGMLVSETREGDC